MNKRLLTTVVILSLLIFMYTIPILGAAEKSYVFNLGHLTAPTSTHGISMEKFAKAVEAESNGNIKISVSHSAALGTTLENIEQVRIGALPMALLWFPLMTSLDQRFGIEDLPYAWIKRQQVYAAFNGELGNKLKQIAESKGIKVIALYELGYRCITNNVRPIYTPEDLKGIKIRVAEVKIRLESFSALGASPIPMAFGELYTGLKLGTVDGQENPLPLIYSSKFYEVQKYLSITKHIWSTAILAINKKIWDNLPKNYQEILERNALKFAEYNNELVREGEKELETKLTSLGMKVNQIDPAPFIKAVKPVWDKYTPIFGKEIMDLVRKYTAE